VAAKPGRGVGGWRRFLVAAASGSIAISMSCSTADRAPEAAGPTTEASHRDQSARPSAVDASIAVLPNGHTRRQIVLTNAYVPSGQQVGSVISIHPTSDPLQIDAPDLPPGGSLLVCPVDGDPSAVSDGGTEWVRRPESCTEVGRSATTSMTLAEADGNTHVSIQFDGTWADPVTLDELHITYEAVDDQFSVEFAVG
jgi:hypothetical protein